MKTKKGEKQQQRTYLVHTKWSNIQFLSNCGFTAASGGHDDIVKLLLDNDADILKHTETGMCGTALHYAAAKSYYECVRYY